MGKHNGKHGTLRRGKSLHDWEQNPYRGKERGANFHTAFVMRGRSKQKVVIWRKKKKKRHSQACFSGREEKCSWCWKELEKKWKKRYFEEWWMLEKKMNVLSKVWLKRSLSGERSVTLMKQRKPRHLEGEGVNNLWCGKVFDSYVEGAFKKHAGLLALLHSSMKEKSSYAQVLEGILFCCRRITWEKAQKSYWIPENLSSAQKLY